MSVLRERIYESINEERSRQDEKWGADRHLSDFLWFTILGEEHGEVAKEVLEHCDGLRDELVQVAAVAVAWLEDIDSRSET